MTDSVDLKHFETLYINRATRRSISRGRVTIRFVVAVLCMKLHKTEPRSSEICQVTIFAMSRRRSTNSFRLDFQQSTIEILST